MYEELNSHDVLGAESCQQPGCAGCSLRAQGSGVWIKSCYTKFHHFVILLGTQSPDSVTILFTLYIIQVQKPVLFERKEKQKPGNMQGGEREKKYQQFLPKFQ